MYYFYSNKKAIRLFLIYLKSPKQNNFFKKRVSMIPFSETQTQFKCLEKKGQEAIHPNINVT